MRDYNKGKKYIILKTSNTGEVKILSNSGLFIDTKSNGIAKEFKTIKEAKETKKILKKNYPDDHVFIYTVHIFCYRLIKQIVEDVKCHILI